SIARQPIAEPHAFEARVPDHQKAPSELASPARIDERVHILEDSDEGDEREHAGEEASAEDVRVDLGSWPDDGDFRIHLSSFLLGLVMKTRGSSHHPEPAIKRTRGRAATLSRKALRRKENDAVYDRLTRPPCSTRFPDRPRSALGFDRVER